MQKHALFFKYVAMASSAAVTILLITFGLSTEGMQKFVSVLLLFGIVLLRIFVFSKKAKAITADAKEISIVFISSLAIFVIVLASGGLHSPLFILIHIYALGIGLYYGFSFSMMFLGDALLIFVSSILLNEQFQSAFRLKPFVAVLYMVSLLIVMPAILFIVNKYRLKDSLMEMLKSYIEEQEEREEVIMSGLQEMVIVMNSSLRILSINEAFRSVMKMNNNDAILKPLFEVMNITNEDHDPITVEDLELDDAIADTAAHYIPRLFIQSIHHEEGTTLDDPVAANIWLRSVKSMDEGTDLIIMIVRHNQQTALELSHEHSLQKLFRKLDYSYRHLRDELKTVRKISPKPLLDFHNHLSEDLLIAHSINNQLVRLNPTLIDVRDLVEIAVSDSHNLANSFHVDIDFTTVFAPHGLDVAVTIPQQNMTVSPDSSIYRYNIVNDPFWLSVLLSRSLHVHLIIARNSQAQSLSIHLEKQDDEIKLVITSHCTPEIRQAFDQFSEADYGYIHEWVTFLGGSGYEGFIAHELSKTMDIAITTTFKNDPLLLTSEINIS